MTLVLKKQRHTIGITISIVWQKEKSVAPYNGATLVM